MPTTRSDDHADQMDRYARLWAVRQRKQDLEIERQRLIVAGGQHRGAQGVSTMDNLTDLERFELERRRAAVSTEPTPPW